MSSAPSDEEWMRRALSLAKLAATMGEVPVGAVLVQNGKPVGAGWNRPLAERDPSAHAEILALRDAGRRLGNYRLPGSRLYVTLEPCVMCAGAIVQARVERVFFAAADPKGGACGSVFDLLPADARFNHRTDCTGGAPRRGIRRAAAKFLPRPPITGSGYTLAVTAGDPERCRSGRTGSTRNQGYRCEV